MWSNRKSIKVVVQKSLQVIPPYCANSLCAWHDPERSKHEGRFARYGTRKISRYPYVSVRFRCRRCRATFSESFFHFSYRDQLAPTYEQIFDLLNGGWTRRRTAKFLGCSTDTVQRRVRKISRQVILVQAKKCEDLQVRESIAFDGLENFSYSQYDPNNINHAVGRESYFVYDFNFAPMNRKGCMSPYQAVKKAKLEQDFGRYPSRSIESAAHRVFSRLLERSNGELVLHTDNHYAYRDAIRKLPKNKALTHLITPAKLGRNFRNRLFAINHLDLLTRQRSSAFKRETISFSKHSIAMIESFVLLMAEKNFLTTVFEKPHLRDPSANKDSPAMRVGIADKVMKFHELFRVRVTKAQVNLSEDWRNFFERRDKSSRRPIFSYAGI